MYSWDIHIRYISIRIYLKKRKFSQFISKKLCNVSSKLFRPKHLNRQIITVAWQ